MFCVAVFPIITLAQTNALTQAQIDQILQNRGQQILRQFAEEKYQVAAVFTRDLTLGARGDDVQKLQDFLQSKPAAAWPTGQVSTGYFGPLTQQSLARYQASVGITPAAGYFGPITRQRVNEALSPQTPGSGKATGVPTVPSIASVSSSPAPAIASTSSSIQPIQKLRLVTPLGSVGWQRNRSYEVRWTGGGGGNSARVNILLNDRAIRGTYPLIWNTPNDGSEFVTIPNSVVAGVYSLEIYCTQICIGPSPLDPAQNSVTISDSSNPAPLPIPNVPTQSQGKISTLGMLQDSARDCPSGETNFYGQCVKTLKVFGQRSYKETAWWQPTNGSTYHTPGVAVDRSSNPNKVYVLDSGNSRILGYSGTLTGANLVFGQPDFGSSACNGDNNLGFYKSPTASSLCLLQFPIGANVAEQWQHMNLDVDKEGNLYVVDVMNNRVLKYNEPYSVSKTNGKGDTVADFVWGQANFTGNKVNQGRTTPDAESLWTSAGAPGHVSTRGVSVDDEGNVWVADTFNNRVLRFLPGQKEADLVLGRKNGSFSSRGLEGCFRRAELTEMCNPTLARINPATGELYVLDEFHEHAFEVRILVFTPPFSNGMAARKVIYPTVPGYWFTASTLAFNRMLDGKCVEGTMWINEHSRPGGGRTLLIRNDGSVVASLADELTWPSGSLGFDGQDRVYIADEWGARDKGVHRYQLRGNTAGCFADFDQAFSVANIPSLSALSEAVGMTVSGDQLIVKDRERIMVWPNYLSAPSGASGKSVYNPGARLSFAVDEKNRLWTTYLHTGHLMLYQLYPNLAPQLVRQELSLYWKDNPTVEVEYSMRETGPEFDPTTNTLWINDRDHNRILRVSNYDEYSKKLLVDLVIGQPNKTSVQCNHNQQYDWTAKGAPSADSLCDVGRIEFDRLGNLYAIENNYECHGNNRITVFMGEDIQRASTLFPNISARKVFVSNSLTQPANCSEVPYKINSPISVAFDSQNQMVVTTDGTGWANDGTRATTQLFLYRNPLAKKSDGTYVMGQNPDAVIRLPMGAPGEVAFDRNDNLIVQDHTWSRVWVINLNEKDDAGNFIWLVPAS
ncbi:MAG: hypothetical protein AAB691_03755 [Patescibacteria group bacterium]